MTRAATSPRADLVDQLFAAAFGPERSPRSLEYKTGVIAALDFRAHGNPILRPYLVGTAQADAFWAGVAEGRTLWSDHQRDLAASTTTGADGA